MALEAGFRGFLGIDDGARAAAGFDVLAARAVAGFATHVHRHSCPWPGVSHGRPCGSRGRAFSWQVAHSLVPTKVAPGMLGGAIIVRPVVPQDIRTRATEAPPPAIHMRLLCFSRTHRLMDEAGGSFQRVFIWMCVVRLGCLGLSESSGVLRLLKNARGCQINFQSGVTPGFGPQAPLGGGMPNTAQIEMREDVAGVFLESPAWRCNRGLGYQDMNWRKEFSILSAAYANQCGALCPRVRSRFFA